MKEIRRILAPVSGVEVVDLVDMGIAPQPEEDDLEPYSTFEENALSKARYFAGRSGLPTVADDSGIEVDALHGAPGVRSKRFAEDGGLDVSTLTGVDLDQANNRHLIERLQGIAADERTARYVCVAALVQDAADPVVVRGEAPGIIIDRARGAGGFGYDPHVLREELGCTYAEMTAEQKDARSHRGAAFRALAERLGSEG